MQAPRHPAKKGPEAVIQKAIIEYLSVRDWHVMVTHGNMYQQGLPDLLAMHSRYGYRMIEVKNPMSFSFTAAQKMWFPIFDSAGMRLHVLVAATESEYQKLFCENNWAQYMFILGMKRY